MATYTENDVQNALTDVVRIGIVPPLELVTCFHVFSPQLPLNLTCKPSHSVIFLLLKDTWISYN